LHIVADVRRGPSLCGGWHRAEIPSGYIRLKLPHERHGADAWLTSGRVLLERKHDCRPEEQPWIATS
jgi:hypothetical protein